MLLRELIVRHVGAQGALHTRGIQVGQAQMPPGVRSYQDGDDAVPPVAGDLLLVSAPVGPGLRDHVDADLPDGVTVMLLLEVELSELPVGRVLAALAVAKLQVVEAVVVSGVPAATVAVVARRTDELIAPQPYLAHELEPGDRGTPAVLRRALGEHALEGFVQRARERVLLAQVGELDARLGKLTTQLDELRVDKREREAVLLRDLDTARGDLEADRKKMASLRASTSFKVVSRVAKVSRLPRRIVRRSRRG